MPEPASRLPPHREEWEAEPVFFPSSEEMPETRRHLGLRTALFQILEAAFSDRATLGSEQFVYWNPSDPRECCAPDVMLQLGEPDAPFDHWRVWDRGAPHLAIEVVSASDFDKGPWRTKLDRYRRMGVQELVRFDADAGETPFRIWDRREQELVARDPASPDFTRCRTLDLYYCVKNDEKLGMMLRFARDAGGRDLLLTPHEARRQADEARRRADEARRQADEARRQADEARLAAEARVLELEAELARRVRE